MTITPATPKIYNFSIFELIDNPVFVMNRQGTWLYCNQAFEQFSGLTQEGILAQVPSMRHFLRSSAAQRCANVNHNFFANNLQRQSAIIAGLINAPNREMQVNKYVLRNKNNAPNGFIGIIHGLDTPQELYLEAEPGTPNIVIIRKPEALTKKELQVLNLIAFGYSTKKIAILLGNSPIPLQIIKNRSIENSMPDQRLRPLTPEDPMTYWGI